MRRSREISIAQQLALWADKLRDLSAGGLMFSQNIHDRENYQTVQDIALELLALATGETLDSVEPLRAPVFSRPTPWSTGDAAIIGDSDRILLIQRADNERWAMPGGMLSVGETPAEGVIREVMEETGIACEPMALLGVYDSRLRGTVSSFHLYQLVFLCRPLSETIPETPPSHHEEVLDIGWFAEDELPREIHPGHVRPIRHAFEACHGNWTTYFDRPKC